MLISVSKGCNNGRRAAFAKTMANGSRGYSPFRLSADLARPLHYQVIPAKNPVRAFHAAHLNCRRHAGRDAGGAQNVWDSFERFAFRNSAQVATAWYSVLVDQCCRRPRPAGRPGAWRL